MFDVALRSAGGTIALVTSFDEKYPPENIIDGSLDTFWPTTGMFPQEFIITFSTLMSIGNIKILCSNEIENIDGQMQREEIEIPVTSASHLRFLIKSAFDHFVSINNVSVNGTAVH
ncbi:PREDICTED: intraflagellar transport protein 25 homolog isoform X3 [Acropora digitifera]|uniref:intraflagellar transport protein 25 homolog isoform X3 n=1 Tax=Acropora digitifera TaxID=70779 RepID=UPI00077AFF50|nr:PREDICTED: intraflagellar transport protein 25 homolog isoform X3 [Acropora digitifera]